MESLKLKNFFLVATPSLLDPNFSKSVIFVYEHNKEGAMGIVINKTMTIYLGSILRQLKIENTLKSIERHPILVGGPVNQDLGFVLYEDPKNHVNISTAQEVLKKIAQGEGPNNFLVALGYSGWQPGQLEKEIQRNDWLVAPLDIKILFETPIEQRWSKAAQLLGIDIHHLSGQIGHA